MIKWQKSGTNRRRSKKRNGTKWLKGKKKEKHVHWVETKSEVRETHPPPWTAHVPQFILRRQYGKQEYWHPENRNYIFAIWIGVRKIASSNRENVISASRIKNWRELTGMLSFEFAKWKGIQDSIELWIPRRWFRILCQKRVVQNPVVTAIPDSSSFIKDSKSQDFGFHRQKFPKFGLLDSLSKGGWMVTFEIHPPYILPTYDTPLEHLLCSLLLLFTSEDICLKQDHI